MDAYTIGNICGIVLFFAIAWGSHWARRTQIRRWNGGVCKDTNQWWQHSTTLPSGERVYTSSNYLGAFSCNITFKVDEYDDNR